MAAPKPQSQNPADYLSITNDLLQKIVDAQESQKKKDKDAGTATSKKVDKVIGGSLKNSQSFKGMSVIAIAESLISLSAGLIAFKKAQKLVDPTVKAVDKLTQSFKSLTKEIEAEQLKKATAGMSQFLTALSDISVKGVLAFLFLASHLDESKAENLAAFFKKFNSIKVDAKKLQAFGDFVDGLGKLIFKLVIGIAIIAILLMFDPIPVIAGVVIVLGIYAIICASLVLLSKVMGPKQMQSSADLVNGIGKLILYMVAGIALMSVMLLVFDIGTILVSTGLVLGIYFVIALGLIMVSKMAGKKEMKDASDAVSAITTLMLAAVASIAIMALVFKLFDFGDILLGVVTLIGTIAAMVGLVKWLASVKPKTLEQATNALAKLTLIMVATTIMIMLMTLFVKSQDISDILLGVGIVVGTIAVMIMLVKWLTGGKITEKRANSAIKTLIAVTALLLVVSLMCLFLFPAIAKKWDEALIGIGIVLVVLIAVGVMYKLIEKNGLTGKAQTKFLGTVKCLIAVLALVIVAEVIALIAIPIGKHWDDALAGLGVVALILIAAGGLYMLIEKHGLTAKKQEKFLGTVTCLAAVEALLVGAEIIALLAIPIGERSEDALKGLAVAAAIIIGVGGIALAIDKGISKIDKKSFITGAIIMGLAEAVLAGVMLITLIFFELCIKSKDITIEMIGKTGLIIGGLLAAVTVIILAVGSMALNPFLWIAVGAATALTAAVWAIFSMIASMTNKFLDLCMKAVEFEKSGASADKLKKLIMDDMIPSITTICDALGEIGIWSAAKAAFIAMMMRPIFDTVSDFIDVIMKVATMNYIIGYDDNGKPMYARLDPSVFGKAAKVVTEGFFGFVDKMSTGFDKIGFWTALTIKSISKSMKPLMEVVSKFVDVVIKVATLQIVTGYDKNGKPMFERVDPSVFQKAAEAVTNGFMYFVKEMYKGFKEMSPFASWAIEEIADAMKPLMKCVATFVDMCIKVATARMVTGYDSNGNPMFGDIKAKQFTLSEDGTITEGAEVTGVAAMVVAGQGISMMFTSFVTALAHELCSDFTFLKVRLACKSLENIAPVMEAVKNFVDAVIKVATAQMIVGYETDKNGNAKPILGEIHGKVFQMDKDGNISEGGEVTGVAALANAGKAISAMFVSFLTTLAAMMPELEADSAWKRFWGGNKLKDAIKSLKGIDAVMEAVGAYTDAVMKLATGHINLGTAEKPEIMLITPTMFAEAANTIATRFVSFVKTLALNLNSYTDEIEECCDALKGIDKVCEGVSKWVDAVSKLSTLRKIESIDKDGNIKYDMSANGVVDIKSVVTDLVDNFSFFITEFCTMTAKQKEAVQTALGDIQSIITFTQKTGTATDSFISVIKSIAGEKLDVDLSQLSAKTTAITDAFKTYIENLTNYTIDTSGINFDDMVKLFNDVHSVTVVFKRIVDLPGDDAENWPTKIQHIINAVNKLDGILWEKLTNRPFIDINDLVNTVQQMYMIIQLTRNADLAQWATQLKAAVDALNMFTNVKFHDLAMVVSASSVVYVTSLTSYIKIADKAGKTSETTAFKWGKLTDALAMFDKALLEKEKKRTEVLKNLSTNVKGVGTALDNVNAALQTLNSFDFEKIKTGFEEINKVLQENSSMMARIAEQQKQMKENQSKQAEDTSKQDTGNTGGNKTTGNRSVPAQFGNGKLDPGEQYIYVDFSGIAGNNAVLKGILGKK